VLCALAKVELALQKIVGSFVSGDNLLPAQRQSFAWEEMLPYITRLSGLQSY
jgi:hypothetical protein